VTVLPPFKLKALPIYEYIYIYIYIYSNYAARSVAVIHVILGGRFELRAGSFMLLRCFRRRPLLAAAAGAITGVLRARRRSLLRRQRQQQLRHITAAAV
jgi:hypothetical protein